MHVFGYDTALSIYRRAGKRVMLHDRVDVSLEEASGNLGELRNTSWWGWVTSWEAVHLVVGTGVARRHTPGLNCHTWGRREQAWPVVDLGNGVFVSSPEFLFLQMANVLDDLPLTFLACELCGLYGFKDDRLTFRQPLTTIAQIEAFLDRRAGARGHERATRALKYAVERSRSPMETALALRLTLPRRRGGYGLEKPLLNYGLAVPGEFASTGEALTISPDLCWPEHRLAVEYESDQHHSGEPSVARDSRRRLLLDGLGYAVITVTNAQTKGVREFDVLAHAIARKLGKRFRDERAEELGRRFQLAKELGALATDRSAVTCAGACRLAA